MQWSASITDDCDDRDASVHPNATLVFNWKDDDCDGIIDEGTARTSALTKEAGITDRNIMKEKVVSMIAYPNPSAHSFTINLRSSNKGPVQLKVTDMLGRIVEVKKV